VGAQLFHADRRRNMTKVSGISQFCERADEIRDYGGLQGISISITFNRNLSSSSEQHGLSLKSVSFTNTVQVPHHYDCAALAIQSTEHLQSFNFLLRQTMQFLIITVRYVIHLYKIPRYGSE
jgi:hypothetical protein